MMRTVASLDIFCRLKFYQLFLVLRSASLIRRVPSMLRDALPSSGLAAALERSAARPAAPPLG